MRRPDFFPPPRNYCARKIPALLLTLLMVMVLPLFPSVEAESSFDVDVEPVVEGAPYEYQWTGYSSAGFRLTNLSGAGEGMLLLRFENTTDTLVTYDGNLIGEMDGSTTSFLVDVDNSSSSIQVQFQAEPDTLVNLSWYNPEPLVVMEFFNLSALEPLTVPAGGLYIDGELKEVGRYVEFNFSDPWSGPIDPFIENKTLYQATFNLSGTQAKAIEVEADEGMVFMGLVGQSISRYGAANDTFKLRSDSEGHTLRLQADYASHYNMKITNNNSIIENRVIPANANETVSVESGVVYIEVTEAEYNQWSGVYTPASILLAHDVVYGYSVEVGVGEYNVTTFTADILLEYESAAVIIRNGSNASATTGSYVVTIANDQNTTTTYPEPEITMIPDVVFLVDEEDADLDGLPYVELWVHDITVSNGGNSVSASPPMSKSPESQGGSQPDDLDNNPGQPYNVNDFDNEGLSTLWEVYEFGTDPLDWDTDDDLISDNEEQQQEPFVDSDGDGLANSVETTLGSNYLSVDSDNDGFEDGAEAAYWWLRGYEPDDDLDYDTVPNINDTYSDYNQFSTTASYSEFYDKDGVEVFFLATDPAKGDSDLDGNDRYWFWGWENVSKGGGTDGLEAEMWQLYSVYNYTDDIDGDGFSVLHDGDSDNDGVSDWLEWTVWAYLSDNDSFTPDVATKFSSDPATSNSDDDELDDYTEIYTYGTNPASNDSDDDGLSDPLELGLPGSGDTDTGNNTDPVDRDSDDDGLVDGTEDANANGAVDWNETDPQDNDTDDDQMLDGWEVWYDTDPLNDDAQVDYDNDGFDEDNNGTVFGPEKYTTLEEYYNGTDPKNNDTDNDTLPDGWEVYYDLYPMTYDSFVDYDQDELDNVAEYENGTDPTSNDTDSDGIFDGWEVVNSFDPLDDTDASGDADADGLTNLLEYQLGSDPHSNDTDGDGMPDKWEYDNGLNYTTNDSANDADADGVTNLEEYQNNMDPLNPDTDGDDLPDGWEFRYMSGGSSPTTADNSSDPDNDGSDNAEEFSRNTEPNNDDTDGDGTKDGNDQSPTSADSDNDWVTDEWENYIGSDPNDVDTDNDGLWDGWCTDLNSNGDCDASEFGIGEMAQETSPTDKDSDDDGLTDGDEVIMYTTNPTKPDTDGDSLWDGWHDDDGDQVWDWVDTDSDNELDDNENYEELGEVGDITHDNYPDSGPYGGYGTKPQTVNSDGDEGNPIGDGIDDYWEIMTWFTDPNSKDSDGDGVDDYHDAEPWGNLEVVFKIEEIVLVGESVDDGSEADFITLIHSNIALLETGPSAYLNNHYINNPDDDYIRVYKEYVFDIYDDVTYVPLYIKLQDNDGNGKVDELDINKYRGNSNELQVYLYVNKGTWCGDDCSLNNLDEDGYGYSTGYDDGDKYHKDAAIWFDVYTRTANPVNNPYGTLDTDGLSQYAETRTYGSDPFDSDSDDDAQMPNGNGINDRLEVLYGLDPTEKPDTAGGTEDYDPASANTADDDGINYGAEAQFGGRSNQKDIFVEVDWMQGHAIREGAIDIIVKFFIRKNIAIRIDSGPDGTEDIQYLGNGGDVVSESKSIYWILASTLDEEQIDVKSGNNNDFLDFKWGNNWDSNNNDDLDSNEINTLNGYFTYSRWGIFRYSLFVDRYEDYPLDSLNYIVGIAEGYGSPWDETFDDTNFSDDFMVADGSLFYNYAFSKGFVEVILREVTGLGVNYIHAFAQAYLFIHELGHTLELDHNEGDDNIMSTDYEYGLFHQFRFSKPQWDTIVESISGISNAALDNNLD